MRMARRSFFPLIVFALLAAPPRWRGAGDARQGPGARGKGNKVGAVGEGLETPRGFDRRIHAQRRRPQPLVQGDRRVAPPRRRQRRAASRDRLRRLPARRRRFGQAPGDLRDQRRTRLGLGLAAIGRSRPLAPADERFVALLAAGPRRQRGDLARLHRSRLHRPAGDRLQQDRRARRGREEKTVVGRRRCRRLERRHPPLARRQRAARLAEVHRRRELRRLSRPSPGEKSRHDPGRRRQRPDPDFAGAGFRRLYRRPERAFHAAHAPAVLRGGLSRKEGAGRPQPISPTWRPMRSATICTTGCAARATMRPWNGWSSASRL